VRLLIQGFPVVNVRKHARCGCITLAIAGAVSLATAQEGAPRGPGAVHRIVMRGDLECARDVRQARDALDAACKERAALVVLELGGNAARLDLLLELGSAVLDAPAPVVVLLNDPDDRRVGPAQLCPGLLAPRCYITPDTLVRGSIAGPLADLAPESTPWAQVCEQLRDELARALARRETDQAFAGILVSPTAQAWVLLEPQVTVLNEPPASRAIQAVSLPEDGPPLFSMDAKRAAACRLVDEIVPSPAAVESRQGIRAPVRVNHDVRPSLAAADARARATQDQAEHAAEEVRKVLKLPDPETRSVPTARYRAAGDRALEMIRRSEATLAELEGILADYPELLRRPAPGQAAVGEESSSQSRWRSLVQTRRDRLERFRIAAERFSALRD
jgi:hypothetical protein